MQVIHFQKNLKKLQELLLPLEILMGFTWVTMPWSLPQSTKHIRVAVPVPWWLFDPHPQEIIHSQQPVSRICTSVHQLRLLEELGLDEVHVIQFTKELSQMLPEDFALQFLIRRFDLVKLVIGYDFRFGKHRAGDFKLLENLSQQYNFSLEEIAPIQQKGQTVSSTLIRQLISEFQFADIHLYLGREYSIYGKVEKGEQRGKELGFLPQIYFQKSL